jgi:hypothetical protein
MIRPIFGDIVRKAVVTFVLAGVAGTLASLLLRRAVSVEAVFQAAMGAGTLSGVTTVILLRVYRSYDSARANAIKAGVHTLLPAINVLVPWGAGVAAGLFAAAVTYYWRPVRELLRTDPIVAKAIADDRELMASSISPTEPLPGLSSDRLVRLALDSPQVNDAGLSPDETDRVQAEVAKTISAHDFQLDESTVRCHKEFVAAKAVFVQQAGAPLGTAAPTAFKWISLACGWLLLTTAATRWLAAGINLDWQRVIFLAITTLVFSYLVVQSERNGFPDLGPVVPVVFFGAVVGSYAVTWAAALPATELRTAAVTSGLITVLAGLLWRWTKPWEATTRKLESDDVEDWPQDDSPARQEVVAAHERWLRHLRQHDLAPVVDAALRTIAPASYDTSLRDASVRQLGDITRLPQFVPTGTSRRLNRMLDTMTSAAIGVSGPRGAGKSTVLRVLGDKDLRTGSPHLGLVVPAPTSYDSREFLVHLFTKLCEAIAPAPEPDRRRRWPWLVAVLGLAVIAAAAAWPQLVEATRWIRGNLRTTALATGGILVVAAVAAMRRPKPDTSIGQQARGHLRMLRYLETQTVTHTGQAKLGVDVGRQHARQRAEIVRSYPQLVDEFRTFLGRVAEHLRDEDEHARVIICIDELDKIGTAEHAERFLNDIKAIFRVHGSFFLVSVSEDAMTTYSRRDLAVRTTFDTAFDDVVRVERFTLGDTRALLVQQVIRMPEPFVWFCHCLSGGLPRDLGRVVRKLYETVATQDTRELPGLVRSLVEEDVHAVAHGQLMRVGEGAKPELLAWIAGIKALPPVPAALRDHCTRSPGGELADQCCAHLRYAAAMLTTFADELPATIDRFRTAPQLFEHLARARADLAVDPALSGLAVDAFEAR